MKKFLIFVFCIFSAIVCCEAPCGITSTTGLGIVKGLSWAGAGALTHYALFQEGDHAAQTAALGATIGLIAVNKGIDILQKSSCVPCVDKALELGSAAFDIAGTTAGFIIGSLGLHYLGVHD